MMMIFRSKAKEMNALLITEECWRNSPLSVVRHTGMCRIGEQEYVIVDKLGRDIFECSAMAAREGRDKAIAPGEPADLIDVRLQKAYRKLGRDGMIKLLEDGRTLKEINDIAKKRLKNDTGAIQQGRGD